MSADESRQELGEYALPTITKEGYNCVAKSSLCAFYLPIDYTGTVFVEDVTLDLKPQANEIMIVPVVHITSRGLTISKLKEKPAIVELMKTVELSDTSQNEVVPLFSNVVPSKNLPWKELDADSHCEVLNDRIRFQVTQFGFFTALTRYQPPRASTRIFPGVNGTSNPIELTIPEVPGFKVQIPSTSVQCEATITATLHYDDPGLCMEGNDYRLATACVEFEPHNLKLKETIPVSLMIPDHTEIIKKYPTAKLQFLCSATHSESRNFDWEVISEEDFTVTEDGGQCIATVTVQSNFGPLKGIWRGIGDAFPDLGPKHEYRKAITENNVKSISARCQVFMSPVTRIDSESSISFNIAILVYPFQASKAYEHLENYECSLCDSGPIPYEFKGSSLLHTLEIRKLLIPEAKQNSNKLSYSETASLSGDFCSRTELEIELDASAKLNGGTVLATLFIKHGADKPHKFSLILVSHT